MDRLLVRDGSFDSQVSITEPGRGSTMKSCLDDRNTPVLTPAPGRLLQSPHSSLWQYPSDHHRSHSHADGSHYEPHHVCLGRV